jgi:hypothetical protein
MVMRSTGVVPSSGGQRADTCECWVILVRTGLVAHPLPSRIGNSSPSNGTPSNLPSVSAHCSFEALLARESRSCVDNVISSERCAGG